MDGRTIGTFLQRLTILLWQDWTIRSWDLDTEHTYVLYSPPDRKSDNTGGGTIEVHIALTPLKPWIFFAAHRRMSVNGRDPKLAPAPFCSTPNQFYVKGVHIVIYIWNGSCISMVFMNQVHVDTSYDLLSQILEGGAMMRLNYIGPCTLHAWPWSVHFKNVF